jgi:hypothetical protein
VVASCDVSRNGPLDLRHGTLHYSRTCRVSLRQKVCGVTVMEREATIIVNLLMYIPEVSQKAAWENLQKEMDFEPELIAQIEEDYFQ